MSITTAAASASPDRAFFVFNAVLSTVALAFLAWILMLRDVTPGASHDLAFLPAVNAALNATSAALLTTGWFAIKRRNRRLHKFCMVSAFVASALFLVCYVTYHYVHGDTRYQGTGAIRTAYLAILASHVILSMAVVPLALTSFYFAFRRAFDRHKKVTRWALPIWLYVSVTGVVIFFMLRDSMAAAMP